jgi:chaperone required for assembly of F1-ATPase
MKRFWSEVSVEAVLRDGPSTSSVPPQDERTLQRTAHPEERLRSRPSAASQSLRINCAFGAAASRRRVSKDGWRVALDGRSIRTQGGAPQVVPTPALAEALAEEWRGQGEEIDPTAFTFRDLADYAIDQVAPDREASIARLLPFAETDTLCYRADPDEPLFRRQQDLWEPLVAACEARHGLWLERVSGVVHHPQPRETIARFEALLDERDAFQLAALETLTSLAASLVAGLAAVEQGADPNALFAAANAEEDWQAELWGWDAQAEQGRAVRLAAFRKAAEFAQVAREE